MSTASSVRNEDKAVSDILAELEIVREKYRVERDKRLRSDGSQQYVEVAGQFAHFTDDPYSVPFERDAVKEDVQVLIVGGGFAGLLTAARLHEAGIDDFRMVEVAGDFGGTWYWNRYPGAQCDTEAYIYLPLLEETNYIPTEKYAHQPEIFAHAQRIGRHYGLYEKALFQTQITDVRWDEGAARWIVQTHRGDEIRARFVVLSSGPMNRPKLPGIPGITGYKGRIFHSSRWDYEFSGGSWDNLNMDKLADKRVALIGTGATGIQIVPYVGRCAEKLYVFQRTPSVIGERGNRPTDPQWAKSLEPGWQKRRMENFNILTAGGTAEEDLVGDGWTDLLRSVAGVTPVGMQETRSPEELALDLEVEDLQKMNRIRARVASVVKDPKTAEGLKPWYRLFCKRPTFNDLYLEAFNLPSVELVDTHGRGPDRITEDAIVFDNVEYKVDAIVFATGFEVGTAYTRQAQYEVTGRDGAKLSDHWADGLRTLHGFFSHGFPNCFHMGLSQNGFTVNYPHMVHEQADHVRDIIQETLKRHATTFEITSEVEDQWVHTIREKALANIAFLESCTPGYYNNEGDPKHSKAPPSQFYGGGPLEFWQLVRDWRAGEMKGLEFS